MVRTAFAAAALATALSLGATADRVAAMPSATRLSSASPPTTLVSSRRLLSFAVAGAAGGSCEEELECGSDLVARSTALPALVGVGPAQLGVPLGDLLGVGVVRGGAGKRIDGGSMI